MEAELQQFVYTKLDPQDSPFGKKDFHMAFYPLQLLQRQDLIEIERRIYFNPTGNTGEKKTVFFLKIKDNNYLVMLNVKSLPDDKDMYGRGGLFMCYGLMFPQEFWMTAVSVEKLLGIFREHIIDSRSTVLSSAMIDKSTGNILSLKVNEMAEHPGTIPGLKNDADRKIFSFLYNLALNFDNFPNLVLKGKPDKISEFLNRFFLLLPDELKLSLGWDESLDGASLVNYPIKIAGFQSAKPTGGLQLVVDAETCSIPGSSDIPPQCFGAQSSSYLNWLVNCKKDEFVPDNLKFVYSISLIIDKDSKHEPKLLEPDNEELESFSEINAAIIRQKFMERGSKLMPPVIIEYIISRKKSYDLLKLLAANFPPAGIAAIAEEGILSLNLSRDNIETKNFTYFEKDSGKRLKVIAKLWNEKKLTVNDLQNLQAAEKADVLGFLIRSDWRKKDWVLELLTSDENAFKILGEKPAFKQSLGEVLIPYIEKQKEFKEIGGILFEAAYNLKLLWELLKSKLDIAKLVDVFLAAAGFDDLSYKHLLDWAKKYSNYQHRYEFLDAFLYPSGKVSVNVLADKNVQDKLIYCLVNFHKYQIQRLIDMGFSRDLVSKYAKTSGGIFSKIKNIFK